MQKIILLLLLFLACQTAFAQSYLKLLRAPANGNYQQIEQFSNGDLLVMDLSLTPFADGTQNEVFMMRLDDCGDIVWSYSYYGNHIFHSVDDIIITEKDEIYIFGGAGIDGKAFIYFAKFNENGERIAYRRYDGAEFDNLSFSVDYKAGRFIFSGLLLGSQSEARSYAVIVDENLDILSAKLYLPNASYGGTVFTADGGAMHQVKNQVLKLDAAGEVTWARTFADYVGSMPISHPVETEGGCLFRINDSGFAFFIKIDYFGNLVWTSDKFPAFHRVPDFIKLPDGQIMVGYGTETPEGVRPATLKIAPDGSISEQTVYRVDYPIDTDFLHYELRPDGVLFINGKAQQDFTDSLSAADIIMRIDPTEDAECITVEAIDNLLPNDNEPALIESVITANEAVFTSETDAVFLPVEVEIDLQHACGRPSEILYSVQDTVLACRESWQVTLPDGFTWEAGSGLFGRPTTLDRPGTFRAARRDCEPTLIRDYVLEIEECPCALYLPTAFSPNDDGVNDCWRPEGFCEMTEFAFRLYDRWGNLLHETDDPELCYAGENLGEGVYVAVIQYTVVDAAGEEQTNVRAQDLTVLR